MDNWKDYVGFQENKELNKSSIAVFYLKVFTENSSLINIRILKDNINVSELTLDESEIGKKVEEILTEFPTVKVKNDIDLERSKLDVVKKTRRGYVKTNYKNTWYYKGGSAYDSPIIVMSYNDKYFVFKHPDFKNYGFNVEN